MATRLRLLLDECLPAELAEEISSHKSLNVEWINNTLMANRGMKDADVMAYARENRRIMVTLEGRLNEKVFHVCTHPGILVFKAVQRHEAVKAGMFLALMRSGVRTRCRNSVTYLRLEGKSTRTIAIFNERDDQGVVQKTVFDLDRRKVIEATRENFARADCRY